MNMSELCAKPSVSTITDLSTSKTFLFQYGKDVTVGFSGGDRWSERIRIAIIDALCGVISVNDLHAILNVNVKKEHETKIEECAKVINFH